MRVYHVMTTGAKMLTLGLKRNADMFNTTPVNKFETGLH